MKKMKFELKEKTEILPAVFLFKFLPPEGFTWEAGQFIFYEIPHSNPDSRGIERHFTISSSPHESQVFLTTRILPENGSTFKQALKNLTVGQKVEAYNLSGQFVIKNNLKMVFIAGGIGITPFRAIVLDLAFKKKLTDVILLYANRDENIIFKNEFDKIAAENPGFKIHYVLEPKRLDEAFLKVFQSLDADYFVSGPPPMVKGVTETLKNLGISKIIQDSFTGYDNI